MLDTVVLTLSRDMYQIVEPDLFHPSATKVFEERGSLGGRGYVRATQNPTKSEMRRGIYKPRLTLTNRFNHTGKMEATLKIEFSAPKLLFGNNFDELQQSDFLPVINRLYSRLLDMGVLVEQRQLVVAPVSAIHYSKNVPLTDGSTPSSLIKKIKQANIFKALDVNETDYRNDGYSFKWHANSYEMAFYDKIHDVEAAKISEKRGLEKDYAIQLGLFDVWQKRKCLEVLRLEARLNRRPKIDQILRHIGHPTDLVFSHLFSSDISKAVLLYFFDMVEKSRPPLLDYQPKSREALLSNLIINNPNLKPQRIMQMFGLKLAFDEINPRELRQMLAKYSNRSWYRLVAEVKSVVLPTVVSPFRSIRVCLDKFVPFKLADYPDMGVK